MRNNNKQVVVHLFTAFTHSLPSAMLEPIIIPEEPQTGGFSVSQSMKYDLFKPSWRSRHIRILVQFAYVMPHVADNSRPLTSLISIT